MKGTRVITRKLVNGGVGRGGPATEHRIGGGQALSSSCL